MALPEIPLPFDWDIDRAVSGIGQYLPGVGDFLGQQHIMSDPSMTSAERRQAIKQEQAMQLLGMGTPMGTVLSKGGANAFRQLAKKLGIKLPPVTINPYWTKFREAARKITDPPTKPTLSRELQKGRGAIVNPPWRTWDIRRLARGSGNRGPLLSRGSVSSRGPRPSGLTAADMRAIREGKDSGRLMRTRNAEAGVPEGWFPWPSTDPDVPIERMYPQVKREFKSLFDYVSDSNQLQAIRSLSPVQSGIAVENWIQKIYNEYGPEALIEMVNEDLYPLLGRTFRGFNWDDAFDYAQGMVNDFFNN
jgi:hypothetical protein